MSAGASLGVKRAFAAQPRGAVVGERPWGRVEELYDGIWAIVSTPLEDRTTLSNGGIIAGTDRVLVVESFASAEGAAWAAEQALALTGRYPTDVVITHYHGDHANGVTGYLERGNPPLIWMTDQTRQALTPAGGEALNDGRGDERSRAWMLTSTEQIAASQSTEIDLGGRTVRLEPRAGHTASDVTVAVDDPSVVFYGDLLWNGMFPNFRDTTPSLFATSIRAARRARETVYVPGHGPLAGAAEIEDLLAVLDEVEAAARASFDAEVSATEAGRIFTLRESLGEWTLLGENYFELAISAWHRELSAPR